MNESNSQTTKVVGGIVITAMVMIGFYFFILHSKPSSDSASSSMNTATKTTASATPKVSSNSASQSTAAPAPSTTSTTKSNSTYKDGQYTASSDYQVPGDINSIQVTVSIKDDVITSVSTQDSYSSHESAGYIRDFKDGISDAVVGKKIDQASVGRLNGASDTSQGFDDALLQIIDQARA